MSFLDRWRAKTTPVKVPGGANAPVQNSWLFCLTWKMQTVLNQALRAPDTHFCPNIKVVCRWMRSVCLRNADPEHTFMCRKTSLPALEDLDNELNYCSMHFVSHFIYGLEIIAYKHPDAEISNIAGRYYEGIVSELLHFGLETQTQLNIRLADNTEVTSFLSLIQEEVSFVQPKVCPTGSDDNYLWSGGIK